MSFQEGEWFEGTSDVSFADAAKKAVKRAEAELGDEEREYEVTLRVTGTPGSSLSEYKALVRST